MAVVFDPNKQQDPNNPNQGQAQQIVGAQAPTSADASTSQTNPNQGTSSGRFSNITNYIKANQNFNQGNGLAGKITSNIQNQGDQVTKNVANAVNQFNQQSQGVVSQGQQGAQAGQTAVANPVQATQDNSTVSAIRNTLDNNYSGPSSLADLSGQQNQSYLQNQAKNLDTQTGQAQTESGRYNLLRTMFNKPNYNAGQQNLDNLLIQGNGNQLQNLQDTRKISNQADQSLNNAVTQTGQAGSKAAQDYAASQNQLINTLNGGVSNINSDLTKKAQDLQSAQNNKISALKNAINSGQVSQDILSQLGLSSGQKLYNVDPTKYITPNSIAATSQNVGSADDYAKINALSNLINGGNKSVATEDVSKLLAQYQVNNPNQFEGLNPYDIDKTGLNTAVSSADSGFNHDYGSIVTPGTQVGMAGSATNLINGTRISSTGNPFQDLNSVQSEIQNPTYIHNEATQNALNNSLNVLQGIINKYTPNESYLNKTLSLNSSLIPNSDFGETQ